MMAWSCVPRFRAHVLNQKTHMFLRPNTDKVTQQLCEPALWTNAATCTCTILQKPQAYLSSDVPPATWTHDDADVVRKSAQRAYVELFENIDTGLPSAADSGRAKFRLRIRHIHNA